MLTLIREAFNYLVSSAFRNVRAIKEFFCPSEKNSKNTKKPSKPQSKKVVSVQPIAKADDVKGSPEAVQALTEHTTVQQVETVTENVVKPSINTELTSDELVSTKSDDALVYTTGKVRNNALQQQLSMVNASS